MATGSGSQFRAGLAAGGWRRKAAVLAAAMLATGALPTSAQMPDGASTFALAVETCLLAIEPERQAELVAAGWIVDADLAFGPANRVVSATRYDQARGDMYLVSETTTYSEAFRHNCTVSVYGPTAPAADLPLVAEDLGLTGTFEPIEGGVVGLLEGPLEGGLELVRVVQLEGYFQLQLNWVIW